MAIKEKEESEEENAEVESEQSEEKEIEGEIETASSGQIKWVILCMILLIAVVIGTYFLFQSFKKFEYAGMDFEKNPADEGIKYNQFNLYRAKIPITSSTGELMAYYKLYLRNDPRKLQDINVSGKIELRQVMVVSLESGVDGVCSDNFPAVYALREFLKTASGHSVLWAYNNQSYADSKNASYAVCTENVDHSTITFKQGSENKITRDSPNCYTLEFKDCDILKVTERFIVATLAHSNVKEI